VPCVPTSAPSRRTSTGISVCAGRFRGAIRFGDSGFRLNDAPRLCSSTPVPGSTTQEPNAWNALWISETHVPSVSVATIATVSPVRRG
jgi:hypothetical protein